MVFEAIPIQQVRAYWDRRPCNIRNSLKPVGSREYSDEVKARKYFVEPYFAIRGIREVARKNSVHDD
jgi:hypothetical protein